MADPRTFPTRNDLSANVRKASIALLNQALANLSDLHSQVKQSHWNVKGMEFIALHKLFDELAEGLEDHIDDVAERVTALGGVAMGTARMAAATSKLPEMDIELTDGAEYVKALADRYGLAGKSIRAALDATVETDADTADLFTDVSRDLDKRLWFLEAHLTK